MTNIVEDSQCIIQSMYKTVNVEDTLCKDR